MVCLLFIPATIQIVHAFEPHVEVICSSDVEHHFHQDELECTLCHLQAESLTIPPNFSYEVLSNELTLEQTIHYNFYKNHQRLSYSLRGPPVF